MDFPAFDTGNLDLFFVYYNSTNSPFNGLYYWNQNSDTFGLLAYAGSVGITATSTGSIPNNAAFYEGAYWYIRNGQNVLSRIDILHNSTTGLPNGAISVANYTINAPATQSSNMFFGDIVINPITRQLYGSTSTGQFFRVDLSDLDEPMGLPFYQIAAPGSVPSLQTGRKTGALIVFNRLYTANLVLTRLTQIAPCIRHIHSSFRRHIHHTVRYHSGCKWGLLVPPRPHDRRTYVDCWVPHQRHPGCT